MLATILCSIHYSWKFLQIIYTDGSIEITNFFKSAKPPYLLKPLPETCYP